MFTQSSEDCEEQMEKNLQLNFYRENPFSGNRSDGKDGDEKENSWRAVRGCYDDGCEASFGNDVLSCWLFRINIVCCAIDIVSVISVIIMRGK